MSTYKHIQLDYLYLMADSDMSFTTDMIYSFKEAIPLYVSDINKSVKSENLSEIRFYAHKLKSSVMIVGAKELSNIASELETKALANTAISDIKNIAGKIEPLLAHVLEELNNELNTLSQA